MTGFKEWLYDRLVSEGVIDADEISVDELSEDMLNQQTEVNEYDLENLKEEYQALCEQAHDEPSFDLPEY